MTPPTDIATIRLLGGHPALDFINTVDAWRDRWGPDFLVHYEDLVAWAERVGLVGAGLAAVLRTKAANAPTEAEAALVRARALRKSLHALFLNEAGAMPLNSDDAEQLNAILRLAGEHRELRQEAGSFHWAWRDEADLDSVLYRVAFEAADLLAARASRRDIRECHGVNCGWLFLDTSRSGRRLWCSEETCGTAMRVRRFRQKDRPEV